eukprot:GSMAST32.ASY1.ANO1.2039.1 assembled CDS
MAGEKDRLTSMSVWGQPTRGWNLTDISGGKDVFIHQPRRQRAGWDGCRDRADKRNDLPFKLLYKQPEQRWNMKSVYSAQYEIIMMFGGIAVKEPTIPCTLIFFFW